MINITSLGNSGVKLITRDIFRDSRGDFSELYHKEKYTAAGIPVLDAQDNVSTSSPGVIRGLHYQYNQPQGKLVTVLSGHILDVAVDIRLGSPTFSKWYRAFLSPTGSNQIYIPEGFAHGFRVLGNSAAVVTYKCTHKYNAETDSGIWWGDPILKIDWREDDHDKIHPIISDKDSKLSCLSKIENRFLPIYNVTAQTPTTGASADTHINHQTT